MSRPVPETRSRLRRFLAQLGESMGRIGDEYKDMAAEAAGESRPFDAVVYLRPITPAQFARFEEELYKLPKVSLEGEVAPPRQTTACLFHITNAASADAAAAMAISAVRRARLAAGLHDMDRCAVEVAPAHDGDGT